MPQASSPRPSSHIGRFAPSPTGPLHFGSLVSALGSYLQARAANGRWLLRIDDLDQERVVPGAADNIIATLAAFGFEWHGEIAYQSRRRERYAAAIETLRAHKRIYACTCSRSQIALWNSLTARVNDAAESDEPKYSGTCRLLDRSELNSHALRFTVDEQTVSFSDTVQGHFSQNVRDTCGDFVVRRRAGNHAYHLAAVVDDYESGVSEVVRGADLLASTPRQILLQRALGLPTPRYCHLPLALDLHGAKLSKSAQSIAINSQNAADVLWQALQFLRQQPPLELRTAPLRAIWNWSIEHWTVNPLIGTRSALAPVALGES